jgi:hypothetical protein
MTNTHWLALCTPRQQKEVQEGSEQISAPNCTFFERKSTISLNILQKNKVLIKYGS